MRWSLRWSAGFTERAASWRASIRAMAGKGEATGTGEAEELRARLAKSLGRWVVIAQAPDEEGAAEFVGRITSRDLRPDVGEWSIEVREDGRRARSGGAFVVWARRVDEQQAEVEGRSPVGRFVRGVRVWRLESGLTLWGEVDESSASPVVAGMPPRIVDEGLRRQLIDRLPRPMSLAELRKQSVAGSWEPS